LSAIQQFIYLALVFGRQPFQDISYFLYVFVVANNFDHSFSVAPRMSLSRLLLLLLLRPDALVVDEIFLRGELRRRRHLFEQRHGAVEKCSFDCRSNVRRIPKLYRFRRRVNTGQGCCSGICCNASIGPRRSVVSPCPTKPSTNPGEKPHLTRSCINTRGDLP
jgi:hypothetical protein